MHSACPPPCQLWEWGCLPPGPWGPSVSPARRQERPRACRRRSRAQFSCMDQVVLALGMVLSASAVYRIRCRNGLWEPGGTQKYFPAPGTLCRHVTNTECRMWSFASHLCLHGLTPIGRKLQKVHGRAMRGFNLLRSGPRSGQSVLVQIQSSWAKTSVYDPIWVT